MEGNAQAFGQIMQQLCTALCIFLLHLINLQVRLNSLN